MTAALSPAELDQLHLMKPTGLRRSAVVTEVA